ncbi:MAG TPA: DUF1800 domain-containing protein [Methylibium sp.]|uniref:DUF1800 domain-containing protein n=1 Tax=Methylibium sp. TaxID=2067992 RepID=UPI002DBFCED8|nr:DUF1800 domain-containing protein [Methylibium sp.]HEU4458953.1 DUF1800 domain-containing protein [Methylibium sp.]
MLTAAVLAACGGNKDAATDSADIATTQSAQPTTKPEAARFLAQASMGPTESEIDAVAQYGTRAWIDAQFNQPQVSHKAAMDTRDAQRAAANEGDADQNDFLESWWKQAATGPDQLRQRVTFALSQIFVISFNDGNVANYPRGVASYYDMLGKNAFGNFRELLNDVSLHPMMGLYLSHRGNQKETATRVPDENYAREVMQLFSIGLFELNPDGTQRLAGAAPIETYTTADVQGLAKVFTGWSWYAGPGTTDRTSSRFFGGNANPDRDWQPMQAYNKYVANTDFHSTSEKSFLGMTIAPQGASPDPEGDLTKALDRLFNHANVGPFFCKQLIQRLVTSNPSPAYVSRCSAAFAGTGGGSGGSARGDMKAVIRAVLLDTEARNLDAASTSTGKLREPVLRLAAWLRAFKATSVDADGRFRGIGVTDDPATSLGQTPMRAPSVFNFYRPGYAPPNTTIATAGLVAPELQIAHEVSVAGYLNTMRNWVPINTSAGRYVRQNYAAEQALAETPAALVDRVNLLLAAGQMSDATKTAITNAVASRAIPVPTTNSTGTVTNQTAIDNARNDRVYIAVFLTLASPDFLVLK